MNLRKARTWVGIFAVTTLAMPGMARAQHGPPPPPPMGEIGYFAVDPGASPGPDDDSIAFVGFEGGVGGKTVTGEPFSATFSTQTTQVLADGNHIQRNTTGSFARDSQGRTRRDVTLPGIGSWAAAGKAAPHVIFVNDVVAGTQYILQPENKVARQVEPFGRMRHGGRAERDFESGAPPPGGPGPENRKDVVTTSLGTQTINGVTAEGTRYTRTIPAGAIGNQSPIVITTERWYSPELQVVVLSKRSDPRSGETVTQLTNIQRSEPDASLFQVPPDYTVKHGGPNVAFKAGGRMEQ